VSRQFTDGEISAAINRIASEGGTLSRTVVRKRLGGGSSSRIDALLKDYQRNRSGAPNGASAGRSAAEVALPMRDTAEPQAGAIKAAAEPGMRTERNTKGLDARNIELIARLRSEIRVLKILLESERKARADDAARHLQTIEALQHEIETYRVPPRMPDDRSGA
jgi:hypothetical protein